MSRKSSGSRRVESSVEPTRSQNCTVSWRRSAAAVFEPASDRSDVAILDFGGAVALASNASPHSPQNLASRGLLTPQAVQMRLTSASGIGAPHAVQNLRPGKIPAPQVPQFIERPRDGPDKPPPHSP